MRVNLEEVSLECQDGEGVRERIKDTIVVKRHTMYYNAVVKHFSWHRDKNEWLKANRNVSFEEVVFYIERGQLLDIVEHPDQDKYPGQRMLIMDINEYAYLIPFIELDDEVFLITIIPSRKATKKYLKGR